MSDHKDGVDNLVIYWDDDDGIYNAGQVLSGKIVVNVIRTTYFGGIRLKISGYMSLKWNEMEAGNIIPYDGW